MKKSKILKVLLGAALVVSAFTGCGNKAPEKKAEVENSKKQEIILATTTSTENSGLLKAILPDFTEKTGIEVKTVAVGTGKALTMGRDGEADVLLVHAKPSEEKFIEEGHGVERFDVMYNDFVLVGNKEDKAKLKELAGSDIYKALQLVKDGEFAFVTRGDDSGTHKKELAFWKKNEITPEGDWYISSGQGMGATLNLANEKLAYVLTDRATYLSMKDNLDLVILVEGDENLFNQYGVMAVNPSKNDKINEEGAKEFISWLLSENTQKLIGEFGIEKFGQNLFNPNAK